MKRQPEDRGSDLRALFFETAGELLQSLNEAGLGLEAHPSDEEILRGVRRAVHTLKGDSAACGLHKLSELAHELEDVLTPEIGRTHGARLAEVVLAAVDVFEAMLGAYQRRKQLPSSEGLRGRIKELLAAPGPGHTAPSTSAPEPKLPAAFEWSEYELLMISEALHRGESVFNVALRIDPKSSMRAAAFQLIRNVLHGCGTVIALRPEDNSAAASVEIVEAALASSQSEEAVGRRCRIPSIVSEIRIERAAAADTGDHELLGELLEAEAEQNSSEHGESPASSQPGASAAVTAVAESTLRVEASRIDSVMNLVGELIIGKSMLHRALAEFDQQHSKDPVRGKLVDALQFQARVLDELHKSVLKIRMVPVGQLFRRFPRIIRDVAKQCGKDVALEVSGQHTDLDKGILDALAEPLTHIVRNAVDHGIEPAEERLAASKHARGTISLNAFHQGTQVVIEIRDDGRGIDTARVRSHAVETGLIQAADAGRLSEADALNLIFEPGFSTAKEVTEVSGRGVGMDVVRSVMDRLKGTVQIVSQPGKGTAIQLRAPLTLASIQTLLFRVGGRLFAVPLSSVVEIARISAEEIHRVDEREVLRLREQILTLVRLQTLSRIHAVDDAQKKNRNFVIVIGAGERRFGLVVDHLVGEEELVIKALPADIVASDLVSGASILGDGTVVLILNVPAVLSRLSRATPLGAIA